ncbi:MAG: hypothetical protein Q8K57_06535 [Thiobacillus sp.]|nr:hypothetical protein [Thiobacillus sp.]
MFSYESGLGIAFMLWLAGIVITLVWINSRFEQNLNKIGQRLGWLTLNPKAMDAEEMKRSTFRKILKFLFIVGIGLPGVLLSWLYVAWFVGSVVYKRTKDAGAPQAVRELRWKMKNTDMSFDQIVREMMKVSEEDPATFEKVRNDLVQEMTDRGFASP